MAALNEASICVSSAVGVRITGPCCPPGADLDRNTERLGQDLGSDVRHRLAQRVQLLANLWHLEPFVFENRVEQLLDVLLERFGLRLGGIELGRVIALAGCLRFPHALAQIGAQGVERFKPPAILFVEE